MKLKLGDKVKIIGNKSDSFNEIGDIGTITEVDMVENDPDRLCYRVTVEKRDNFANWHSMIEVEIINED
jgi:hypothetical protein